MRVVHGIAWWTLALAVGLHVVAVLARSEAWTVSVRAAGATLSRRLCYQAASFGFAANVLAPSLGTGVRIWILRRLRPEQAPVAGALVTAEVPVLVMQGCVCALMSFLLVGRLGAPWWAPVLGVLAAAAVLACLPRVARRRTHGFWRGLGALRRGSDGSRVAGCVGVILASDVIRTLLLLHAIGLRPSIFDAMALRVASGVLATLPIGPGSGAGAAVLIFGAHAAGRAVAAGALLTATGLAADVGFGVWGVADLAWRARVAGARLLSGAVDMTAGVSCACLIAFVAVAAT